MNGTFFFPLSPRPRSPASPAPLVLPAHPESAVNFLKENDLYGVAAPLGNQINPPDGSYKLHDRFILRVLPPPPHDEFTSLFPTSKWRPVSYPINYK